MLNDYRIAGGRKPVFEHDCDECRFLGTIARREGRVIQRFARDVYYCEHEDPDEPVIILRTGSYGGDYRSYGLSMIRRVARGDDVLTIALCMFDGVRELSRVMDLEWTTEIPETSRLDRSARDLLRGRD